ncbi:hypothetical protein BDW69DRAFT_189010 [Aspergillus filifer]
MAFQSSQPFGPLDPTVTNEIIKGLVNSDQSAWEYRGHLEFRLREECQRSAELESKVANLQWSRSQLEATVQHAATAVGELQKELEDLRRKNGSSECRIVALSSLSDSLLRILSNISASKSAPQEAEIDIVQMSKELRQQQGIISELNQSSQRHSKSLQALKTALEVTLFGEPYWTLESDNESVAMAGTTSESAPLLGSEGDETNEGREAHSTLCSTIIPDPTSNYP